MDNTPPDAIAISEALGRAKDPVRIGWIFNVATLSAMQAGTSLDGVTLANNDRVLLTQQTTASQNGIYVIHTASAPTRATDADGVGELRFGDFVYVTAGAVGAGSYWRLITTGTITIGTTGQTWVPDNQGISISSSTMSNTAPTSVSVSGATMSNTSPTSVAITGVSMSDTAPTGVAISNTTFANTTPAPATLTGVAFSNTAPTQMVLPEETSPVSGVTPPTPPNIVSHTTTLVAGTHYTVTLGTRSAIVTINLPDPGSSGQRIEIADISGQNATYNTTVSGGTKQIENLGTSYSLVYNYQVLAIFYDGTKWKII